MKKLLYQFDTDALPSVFDNVVGYDGRRRPHLGIRRSQRKNVGGLVEGAIFTPASRTKKTRDLHRGGNLIEGEAVLAAVRRNSSPNSGVSVMFDCTGSKHDGLGAVAWLAHGRSLAGKRAVVLGGSGPVRSTRGRAVGPEGALWRSPAQARCREAAAIRSTARSVSCTSRRAPTNAERGAAIDARQIVLATGAPASPCWTRKQWQDSPTLELLADANASPRRARRRGPERSRFPQAR